MGLRVTVEQQQWRARAADAQPQVTAADTLMPQFEPWKKHRAPPASGVQPLP
jgi:hypothetical protein